MKKPSIKTTTAVLAAGLFSATSYANTCQTLVWSDEFNGTTLDFNNWEVQTGDGCAEGICGWDNNELQSYQADNLTVANGTLTITAKNNEFKPIHILPAESARQVCPLVVSGPMAALKPE